MEALGLILIIIFSILIYSLFCLAIQHLLLYLNYRKLFNNMRIFCDFKDFKEFNKYFCDLYNLSVEDYEVIYFYISGAIIRINKDYFKFDGSNLIYLFNSKIKLENRLDIEINKIDSESKGNNENE